MQPFGDYFAVYQDYVDQPFTYDGGIKSASTTRFYTETGEHGQEDAVITKPSKKEVSQAAKDLAHPNTSKAQKAEAVETLNYRKEAKAAPPLKKGK